MISLQKVHTILLKWFEVAQRNLPWRKKYDPYEIWVSEIMLQQTRVDTVVDYFNRWMLKFPNIPSLANANEEEVLKMWEGLGYYSRVRNLHATAKKIFFEYNSKLPKQYEFLISLPGIGPYTAGAISSIAYNQPLPIVDGNVERVLSRLLNWNQEIKSKISRDFFTKTAQTLVKFGNPRNFNQALMEFGALVCTPQIPSCTACPLNTDCLSYQNNLVSQRPIRNSRPKITKRTFFLFVFRYNNKYYLEQQQESWWKGMWLFPFIEHSSKKNLAKIASKMIYETYHIDSLCTPLKSFSHSITKYRILVNPYLIDVSQILKRKGSWFFLEELEKMSLPKPGVQIRKQLLEFK